jgi:hypothetical protein
MHPKGSVSSAAARYRRHLQAAGGAHLESILFGLLVHRQLAPNQYQSTIDITSSPPSPLMAAYLPLPVVSTS